MAQTSLEAEEHMRFNSWSVLQADLQYNGIVIGIVFAIAMMFFIGDVFFESTDIYMVMGVTSFAFYASMWIIGATDDKEKRDRQQTLLPVPIRTQSFIRLFFCLLIQWGLTIIWLILFLVKYYKVKDTLIWDMLSFNGLNIMIILVFVIFADLGHLRKKIYRYIFLAFVLAVFALSIYLSVINIYEYPLSFGPELMKTPLEALVYNLVAIGLVYVDYVIFIKRRLYLT